METYDFVIVAVRAEADGVTIAGDDVHSEHGLVELERPIQIGNLQPYSTEVR
jgi:hypothetical protein